MAKRKKTDVLQPEPPQQPEQPGPRPNAAVTAMVRRDDTMAIAFQGLVPASIGEALSLAQNLARSRAIPPGMQGQPETVLTVIMAGNELGLTPIRSLQQITNIKGRLCIAADLQLAQVRRSGTLAFFDEGFEFRGKTDLNLAERTKDGQKILALVATMTDQKPYGWCTVQRKGDPTTYTKVFTWDDAERVDIRERDEDGSEGQATKKKLSEKTNYRNYPQDMYPKRARARTLQLSHSDVLAGMPAIETMDSAYIDAEVISNVPAPTSSEDTIDALLKAIRDTDAEAYQTIVAGFDQLQLAIAKRLQLLRQFTGNATGLVSWLKNEYANRKTGGRGYQKPDVLSGSQDASKRPAGAQNQAGGASNQAADESKGQPDATKEPVEESGGMESLKTIAARFQSGPSF
jgi:hypothetical protein